MKLINKKFTTSDNSLINYYETENKGSILLMIHAQGANSSSFFKQVQQLSKNFHIILVDCYGHGKSSHNMEKYNFIKFNWFSFIFSPTSLMILKK